MSKKTKTKQDNTIVVSERKLEKLLNAYNTNNFDDIPESLAWRYLSDPAGILRLQKIYLQTPKAEKA